MAVVPLAASAQQTPITRFARFTGTINFVATGGSLRTQPNGGNACAVGASSSQALAGIPAGASIVAAYLYWGGSGAAVDANVTLNGQAVAAQRKPARRTAAAAPLSPDGASSRSTARRASACAPSTSTTACNSSAATTCC
jgi:hypothetical protein